MHIVPQEYGPTLQWHGDLIDHSNSIKHKSKVHDKLKLIQLQDRVSVTVPPPMDSSTASFVKEFKEVAVVKQPADKPSEPTVHSLGKPGQRRKHNRSSSRSTSSIRKHQSKKDKKRRRRPSSSSSSHSASEKRHKKSQSRQKTSKPVKEDMEAAIPGRAAQPSAAELQLSALQQSASSAASQASNLQQLAAFAHMITQGMQTQNIPTPNPTLSHSAVPGTAVGNVQQPGNFNLSINPALLANLFQGNAQNSNSLAVPARFTF